MTLLSILAFVFAFTLSASAGMGGSLILVPAMALIFGSKTGIAISAILLGCNNIFKAIAYRKRIPFKAAFSLLIITVIGTWIGSSLMVMAPEHWVDWAVIASILFSFLMERNQWKDIQVGSSVLCALGAGITSGFSGTSGPLKGIALKNLKLDRFHLVGAASIISLAGDLVKVGVFAKASLFDESIFNILAIGFFIMPLAVYTGKMINERIGEKAYNVLFWVVMTGYSIRLLLI